MKSKSNLLNFNLVRFNTFLLVVIILLIVIKWSMGEKEGFTGNNTCEGNCLETPWCKDDDEIRARIDMEHRKQQARCKGLGKGYDQTKDRQLGGKYASMPYCRICETCDDFSKSLENSKHLHSGKRLIKGRCVDNKNTKYAPVDTIANVSL